MKKQIVTIAICILALIIGSIIYVVSMINGRNVEAAIEVDDIQEEEFEIILESEEYKEEIKKEQQEEISLDELTDEINEEEKIESEKEEVKKIEEPKQTSSNRTSNTTNASNKNNSKPYYIKVNNQANVVTIYAKDESGNYAKPVKAMICSTGIATPKSGTYTIKGRWEWLNLINGVYGHYSTQITGNILFHSVPYLEKWNPGSLEYWEYDKLGTACSAGCVRLTIADAKWIFNNIASGTLVEFYNSSDPGPLRKAICKKDF